MKLTVIATAFLIAGLASPAFADHDEGNGNSQDGNSSSNSNRNRNRNDNNNNNSNRNNNVNSNTQGQSQAQGQRQFQGQAQGQDQGQRQSTRNSNNAAQSTHVEMNTPRQAVPAAGVSAAGTTATCRIAGGASMGAVWGGFGISGSVLDTNCARLEIAKAMIWAGTNVGDAALVARGVAMIREADADLTKEVEGPFGVSKAALAPMNDQESAFASYAQ